MTDAGIAVEPVHKTLVVGCSPERAFEVFTREIGSWWPLHRHSIGEDRVVEVVVEERAGGRVFERHSDGGEADWGTVLEWDPPAAFAMTWHPGGDPEKPTRVSDEYLKGGFLSVTRPSSSALTECGGSPGTSAGSACAAGS